MCVCAARSAGRVRRLSQLWKLSSLIHGQGRGEISAKGEKRDRHKSNFHIVYCTRIYTYQHFYCLPNHHQRERQSVVQTAIEAKKRAGRFLCLGTRRP